MTARCPRCRRKTAPHAHVWTGRRAGAFYRCRCGHSWSRFRPAAKRRPRWWGRGRPPRRRPGVGDPGKGGEAGR